MPTYELSRYINAEGIWCTPAEGEGEAAVVPPDPSSVPCCLGLVDLVTVAECVRVCVSLCVAVCHCVYFRL